MVYFIRKLQATVAFIISLITISSIAYADDVITFAEADTITGESLINLIAFERAKARGVKAEAISLQSDDLVFQAVLNGQVEVGVGSAYAAMQTLGADAPVRNFYQLKKLGFLCVVNKDKVKTTTHLLHYIVIEECRWHGMGRSPWDIQGLAVARRRRFR